MAPVTGGNMDGGTTITLFGRGFHEFEGNPNLNPDPSPDPSAHSTLTLALTLALTLTLTLTFTLTLTLSQARRRRGSPAVGGPTGVPPMTPWPSTLAARSSTAPPPTSQSRPHMSS